VNNFGLTIIIPLLWKGEARHYSRGSSRSCNLYVGCALSRHGWWWWLRRKHPGRKRQAI